MSAPKLSIHAVKSLGRALGSPLAWRGKAIGAALRERIILRVSSINSCYVCSAVHGTVARVVGVTAEQVEQARSREPADDERTRAALRYAEIRTTGQEEDFPQDVAGFEAMYSPQERHEVRTIVDLFTFNNRFNNTWEALIPGGSMRRRRMGIEP
ncbi:MAG: carboxymuconolactone decarboxylase family protein [Deltaproteobacteria bacterium]|nr:carboxymuconolactone decarboxylase family protein [Deltaproteobacteria bacterium]